VTQLVMEHGPWSIGSFLDHVGTKFWNRFSDALVTPPFELLGKLTSTGAVVREGSTLQCSKGRTGDFVIFVACVKVILDEADGPLSARAIESLWSRYQSDPRHEDRFPLLASFLRRHGFTDFDTLLSNLSELERVEAGSTTTHPSDINSCTPKSSSKSPSSSSSNCPLYRLTASTQRAMSDRSSSNKTPPPRTLKLADFVGGQGVGDVEPQVVQGEGSRRPGAEADVTVFNGTIASLPSDLGKTNPLLRSGSVNNLANKRNKSVTFGDEDEQDAGSDSSKPGGGTSASGALAHLPESATPYAGKLHADGSSASFSGKKPKFFPGLGQEESMNPNSCPGSSPGPKTGTTTASAGDQDQWPVVDAYAAGVEAARNLFTAGDDDWYPDPSTYPGGAMYANGIPCWGEQGAMQEAGWYNYGGSGASSQMMSELNTVAETPGSGSSPTLNFADPSELLSDPGRVRRAMEILSIVNQHQSGADPHGCGAPWMNGTQGGFGGDVNMISCNGYNASFVGDVGAAATAKFWQVPTCPPPPLAVQPQQNLAAGGGSAPASPPLPRLPPTMGTTSSTTQQQYQANHFATPQKKWKPPGGGNLAGSGGSELMQNSSSLFSTPDKSVWKPPPPPRATPSLKPSATNSTGRPNGSPPLSSEPAMRKLERVVVAFLKEHGEVTMDAAARDAGVKEAWKEVGRVPLWKLLKQFPDSVFQKQQSDGVWKIKLL